MPPTRVALYTRVSTEDQVKEGFSLDAQMKRLRHYARAEGWEIAGEYVDEGKSARTIGRKQYRKMMEERATWDTLLVLRMDRIHRNGPNFRQMTTFLKEEGKTFVSATEAIETETATGRFVADTIARLAELGSDTISENVVIGMKEKFEQNPGIYQNGVPPWGYALDRKNRLVAIKRCVPTIRSVFDMADRQSLSASQIYRRLKYAGVKRWPNTGVWQWAHVIHILLNPAYCGDLVFGEHFTIKDYYPAVVTRAQFKRANLKFVRHLAAASPDNFHRFHERNKGRRLDADAVRIVRAELAKGEVEPHPFKVPMGYELSTTGVLREKVTEAKVVRYIFAAFECGLKRHEIAKRVESAGVTRPFGGPWGGQTIDRVLTQRFYMGVWKYRGYTYKTNLKPMISRPRFLAVQRRLKELKDAHGKRYGRTDFNDL